MAYIIYVLLYSLRKVPAVHASVESSNTSTKIFGVEECFCLPVPGVLAYLRRRIKVLSILVKMKTKIIKIFVYWCMHREEMEQFTQCNLPRGTLEYYWYLFIISARKPLYKTTKWKWLVNIFSTRIFAQDGFGFNECWFTWYVKYSRWFVGPKSIDWNIIIG